MANVLVTGGAGYVGSVCCAELLNRGHAVTVVDDLSTGFRTAVPKGAAFFEFNIGDRAGMESLVRNIRFDVVFHFAAKAKIPESVANPGLFFQENVSAGITMLEVLRAANIKNFVFSSSAAVYGSPERIPVDEDDPKKPVNAYGETKLIFEQILRWYAEAYGWSVIAFRYFNAAGATAELGERHDPETHVIPLLLQAAAGDKQSFSIYGTDYDTPDGTCIRDYVHVLDIASGLHCVHPQMVSSPVRVVEPLELEHGHHARSKRRARPARDGSHASLCDYHGHGREWIALPRAGPATRRFYAPVPNV